MVEPPKRRLQIMLQAAVQTFRWTYSLFWQLCPQRGILVWSDGYYNGAIKTRKTVQPTDVSTEDAALHRSQQLRELYESLAAGDTGTQSRRPSAALSPEDLTESEWFYLMCISFSFLPGAGLPGQAYANRKHIWLTRANEADSRLFSRAILAKSARIQTVVCIPLLDGVLELGTTEKVQEDIGLIQRVKNIFTDCPNPNPPRPALSEHSTSNPPPTSSSPVGFYSPATLPACSSPHLPFQNSLLAAEEEEDDEVMSDSDSEKDRADSPTRLENTISANHAVAEPMQLDMSDQHIRLGLTDDSSNDLDSDLNFHLVAPENSSEHHPYGGVDRDGSMHRWPLKDPMSSSLQPPHSSGIRSDGVLVEDDTYYSQTVSSILENRSNQWPKSTTMSSASSAFSRWSAAASTYSHNPFVDGASQWALKYILFTVPLLHTNAHDPTMRIAGTHQDDLSGNHVLAERRRREKLNERFVVLRSMVPFVTKMDKASILGDTVEYLNQLRKKIQELESQVRNMKARKSSDLEEQRRKRKVRVVENGGGGRKPEVVGSPAEVQVEVSIIERDALVEIQCSFKEGLLLDVMQVLGELGIHVITVQSSINNGAFAVELRAQVKENANGRKVSIIEVKRAINQIIIL